MDARELYLEHDGLILSASLYGQHDAPLVILVHGFPDTPYSWNKLVPIFLSAGYQVLTPWLRGYTPGSAKRGARYDLLSVAADIEAWRRELKANQTHLVGHDWGAVVANVLAGQLADSKHWRSISLLAIPPLPPASQWPILLPQLPRQLSYSSYMAVMQLSVSHRLLSRNNAAYVEKLWRRWSPDWAFSANDIAPAREVFSDPELAWAATRYYRQLFRWHDPRVRDAFHLMSKPFTVPTLALAGVNDGCMHARTHEVIAQALELPSSSRGLLHMQMLPNCGHFLHAEQPRTVAAILLAHFARSVD